MKKVALLISFMLVFTLASFAQIDVTVTGSSTITLGIALDEPVASGFINENDAKIAFSLVKGTVDKGAEEDVYGYIEIKGFEYSYKTGNTATKDYDPGWTVKAGDVTAKIMFPMGWVKISGTSSDFSYVAPVQDDDGDKDNADKGLNPLLKKSGGLILGLDLAPLAVELAVFSENDWKQDAKDVSATYGWVDDDDDETTAPVWGITESAEASQDDINDEHAYGVGLKVKAAIAPLTVEVGALLALNYKDDQNIGLGGKVSADMSPLKVYVAADVTVPTVATGETFVELGGGVSVDLIDGVSFSADASMGVAAVNNTDIRIKATEAGVGGAIPGLGLSLIVELFNLQGITDDDSAINPDLDAAAEWSVGVDLDYTTDLFKPYAKVRYGTYTAKDNKYTYVAVGNEPIKVNLGVELYLITNVVFTIDYNSDNVRPNTAGQSNGVLKLKAKISY